MKHCSYVYMAYFHGIGDGHRIADTGREIDGIDC